MSTIVTVKQIRITSFFGNSNILSAYLVSILPFALAILFAEKKIVVKRITPKTIIAICFIVVSLVVVCFTISRIAIFAWIVITCIYLTLRLNFLRRSRFAVNVALLALLILAIVLAFFVKSDSTRGRHLIWKVSSNIAKDHWLTGVGFGRFDAYYNKYQSLYFGSNGDVIEQKLADQTFYPFNELLQIQVENGLFGCVIFLLIIFFVFKSTYSLLKEEKIQIYVAPYLSILSILIIGMVSYPLQETSIKVLFFCTLAILLSIGNERREPPNKSRLMNIITSAIILALSCMYFYRCATIKDWIQLAENPNKATVGDYLKYIHLCVRMVIY